MPKINGIEVGKEILAVNPRQRIIFASAYPLTNESIINETVEGIRPNVDILRKPFTQQTLVDKIENKETYAELQKLNVDIDCIKAAEFRHDQLRDMLRILKRTHKKYIMQSSCERGDMMGKEKELELLTHRVYGEDEDENGNSDDPEPVIE